MTLPAITDGFQQGPQAVTPNPNVPGGVLLGTNTDFITVIYADNTIVDTVHNTTLNSLPIFLAASGGNPGCPAGSLDPTGLTATFDATCITLPAGNTAITPGDLIMFQNANGATLQTVTAVAGQTLTFRGRRSGRRFRAERIRATERNDHQHKECRRNISPHNRFAHLDDYVLLGYDESATADCLCGR